MNNLNPLLLVDAYKVHHKSMYPDGMTKLYSNLTPRKSRIPGIESVVVFGLQHFIKEYLISSFNENFFGFSKEERIAWTNSYGEEKVKERLEEKKAIMVEKYKRHCNVDTTHVEQLFDLGYLPIEIKALEEGTLCPIGVPLLTITNTHPDFGWLVNYLETLISCMLWQPITSATIAYEYKKLLEKYALETNGSTEGVQWQGHDFSMRGMSSPESAILSAMGHLLSFTGTDTIPAIYQLESSYNATGLIGASVPATEHSVMCMGQKESEVETFSRLMKTFPTGILSVVSDTWDLWKVLTEYLPELKEQIISRDGKLVIRPDSGDPVDIICGEDYELDVPDMYKGLPIGKFTEGQSVINGKTTMWVKNGQWELHPKHYGVIELLYKTFGGTINEQGYIVLDEHIGAIYGDSITLDRAEAICKRLMAKGFASINVVFGIGSFTYQYHTRDTFGFAMKATYGEITHKGEIIVSAPGFDEKLLDWTEAREIFKDPITDDGTKRSKKGLLEVHNVEFGHTHTDKSYTFIENVMVVQDQRTWEQEKTGLLSTVFKDGKLERETSLEEIRNKLK